MVNTVIFYNKAMNVETTLWGAGVGGGGGGGAVVFTG